MADNTVLSAAVGTGDTIRDLDTAAGVKWPVGVCSYATTVLANTNVLQIVQLTAGLPVQPGTNTVWAASQSGNWSVTAAAGTNLNTSALALEAGNLAAINTKIQAGITANAGTNLNTSLLALESGGNLAAINSAVRGTLTINTSGLANTTLQQSEISVLSDINTAVRGTLQVSGTLNAGTNLNTALLALESGGNLAAINSKLQGTVNTNASQGGTWNVANLTSITNNVNVAQAGNWAMQQSGNWTVQGIVNTVNVAQSGAWTVNANAGSNLNTSLLALEAGGNLAAINTKTPALGQAAEAASSPVVLPASQITTLTPLNTIQIIPGISGGLNFGQWISGTNTNNTSVKSTPGQLYEIVVGSICTSPMYLKLYNMNTAPVAGTSTPLWTLAIPANVNVGGLAKTIPEGLNFSLGIGFTLTLGIAVTDATCTVVNTAAVNLGWK